MNLASYNSSLNMKEEAYKNSLKNTMETSKANNEAISVVDMINKIDPNKLFGKANVDLPLIGDILGNINTNQKAYLDYVINNLTLENRMKLKGQGAITDRENEMLAKSATILSKTRISPEVAQAELNRIKEIFSEKAGGYTGGQNTLS